MVASALPLVNLLVTVMPTVFRTGGRARRARFNEILYCRGDGRTESINNGCLLKPAIYSRRRLRAWQSEYHFCRVVGHVDIAGLIDGDRIDTVEAGEWQYFLFRRAGR